MASSGFMGAEEARRSGSGARGGGREQHGMSPVGRKRIASIPSRIEKRIISGEDREDTPERGFVRLSKCNTDILVGVEDISTWDTEEIRRGRKRDKDGGWRGRTPVVVPMALHQEAIKRTFEEAQELFREGLVPAVKYLTSVVESDEVEDKDKLKAVSMILDRVMGKAVERVEIKTGTEPWEDAILAAVVPLDTVEVPPIETEEEEQDAAVDSSS